MAPSTSSSRRKKLLFFAKSPNNVAVYHRPLLQWLADPRLHVCLCSKSKHTHPANAIFDEFHLPVENRLHHRWAAMIKFDLYISPDIYLLSRRSRIKVHTFHGISIKGRAYSDKALSYDKLFLIGPYQRRRFAELGIMQPDDPRFVEIGMPKTDAFFDGSLDRKRFLEERGLDPAKPTILYAPTWRAEASLHTHGENLITSMKGTPYNFLIKLHDLSLNPEFNTVDWRAKLAALMAPNMAAVYDSDATPALHASDLLISDASSVANEFALLDRPLVFIDVPTLFGKYEKTIDLKDWGQNSGPIGRTVPEIHRLIERSLSDPGEYSPIRARIAAEGFYNRGCATEAAVKEVARLLRIGD